VLGGCTRGSQTQGWQKNARCRGFVHRHFWMSTSIIFDQMLLTMRAFLAALDQNHQPKDQTPTTGAVTTHSRRVFCVVMTRVVQQAA
jgi:hypothetical protein